MQWKQIIRAAFELDEEEWDQAVKLRALSETERELLMTALGPQKPAAKKSSKKAGKKSARAAGVAAAISNSLQRGRGVVTGDRDGSCANCDYAMDHNIHHLESMTGHHPFTPAAQSTEPPSDQASSEIGKGAAGVAAQGAGGGD